MKRILFLLIALCLCVGVESQAKVKTKSKAKTTAVKKKKSMSKYDKMMLGTHLFSLQWISWKKFGKVTITKGVEENTYFIEGGQDGHTCSDDPVGREARDYAEIEGVITVLDEKHLLFEGRIHTRVYHINEGGTCFREGVYHFDATGNRRYWRLREMDNPNDNAIDYIDIYFK